MTPFPRCVIWGMNVRSFVSCWLVCGCGLRCVWRGQDSLIHSQYSRDSECMYNTVWCVRRWIALNNTPGTPTDHNLPPPASCRSLHNFTLWLKKVKLRDKLILWNIWRRVSWTKRTSYPHSDRGWEGMGLCHWLHHRNTVQEVIVSPYSNKDFQINCRLGVTHWTRIQGWYMLLTSQYIPR